MKGKRQRLASFAAGTGCVVALLGCSTEPERSVEPSTVASPAETQSAVGKKVMAIVVEQLALPGNPKSSDRFVTDLNADSLDAVELVMAFEEAFDVQIPDEDAEKMTTVGEVITYLEKKAQSKK
jgi:acyl carrier protein